MIRKNLQHYSHQWINEADIRAVTKVLRSDFITRGPKVEEFEKALCAYTGAKYAVVFSSATTALYALLDLLPGKTVTTTPYTFKATYNAAYKAGKKVIFSDIERSTFNLNPKTLEKADILIAVDFAGNPCDYDALRKKHKGIIVADAAHSFGATYKGRKVGTLAYATVLSFHPLKTITTGEGGAVLTDNPLIALKLEIYRNHGGNPIGGNYHMTDFQAALGISQLKRIDKFLSKRRKLAKIYLEELKNVAGIELPVETKNAKSAWHLFPIKTKYSAYIRFKLFNKHIKTAYHYVPGNYNINKTAWKCYSNELSLPLHPKMTKADVLYVCKAIKEAMSDLCSGH